MRPEGMICRGCGLRVKELTQPDMNKLWRGFEGEHQLPVRSFQCDQCETILSSDELNMGRFVPPQFRLETTATPIGDPERPLPLSSRNDIVVTVEATGPFRNKPA